LVEKWLKTHACKWIWDEKGREAREEGRKEGMEGSEAEVEMNN
jgi:hypothetical protein